LSAHLWSVTSDFNVLPLGDPGPAPTFFSNQSLVPTPPPTRFFGFFTVRWSRNPSSRSPSALVNSPPYPDLLYDPSPDFSASSWRLISDCRAGVLFPSRADNPASITANPPAFLVRNVQEPPSPTFAGVFSSSAFPRLYHPSLLLSPPPLLRLQCLCFFSRTLFSNTFHPGMFFPLLVLSSFF